MKKKENYVNLDEFTKTQLGAGYDVIISLKKQSCIKAKFFDTKPRITTQPSVNSSLPGYSEATKDDPPCYFDAIRETTQTAARE